ncbi:MAG TPA: AAA family ATPase [Myxococcota bacterium]|nr:AAA family ATPase [Myxococcota bacterium]
MRQAGEIVGDATIPLYRRGAGVVAWRWSERIVGLFTNRDPDADAHCALCGKPRRQVRQLVAGTETYICNECVVTSYELLGRARAAAVPELPATAELLRAALDAGAVGQQPAKRALAAALWQHLYRVKNPAPQVRVPRVLLVGPSGSGKTALGRALCEATTLPAHLADVGRLTESGYVGEDVENLLRVLLREADEDAPLARQGVLFLDALEKIVAREPPRGAARDISGEGVQRELLRLLDGLEAEVHAGGARHPQMPMVPFRCDTLLVGAAATFRGEAFEAPASERALRDALVAAGLLPELVARFDVIVRVPALRAPDLVELLARPERGLLHATRRIVESFGGTLEMTSEAMVLLAEAAAGDPDGSWALSRPLARLAQEVLESPAPGRDWKVDADKARALLG